MKLKYLLISAALLLALYVVNYFVTPNLVGVTKLEVMCRPRGTMTFLAEGWKRATPGPGVRFAMVDDLMASNRLIDLDTNQVERLLGEPDIASDQGGEKQYVYVLGYEKDYPVRSIWFPGLFRNLDRWMLEVRFRNAKVTIARVFFT